MKYYHRWTMTALFIVGLGASSLANAALLSRLGGLAYYDTSLNVTWLADANYSGTSGYAPGGLMTWSQANTWAASLTVDGISGWRLPLTVQPDPNCSLQINPGGGFPLQGENFNCTDSEMPNLFKELGGVAGQSITTTHNSNYSLFTNVQAFNYWSATEYAPANSSAWYFDFFNGVQAPNDKTVSNNAWAVHPGDVVTVPLPAAAWLFGSGLLGLVGMARRNAA
ncbi:MAG: VPLPA-CTERM sorting domain-containing protein [Sulfuricaulis sp.]